jgi:hypothetical protein
VLEGLPAAFHRKHNSKEEELSMARELSEEAMTVPRIHGLNLQISRYHDILSLDVSHGSWCIQSLGGDLFIIPTKTRVSGGYLTSLKMASSRLTSCGSRKKQRDYREQSSLQQLRAFRELHNDQTTKTSKFGTRRWTAPNMKK